MIKAKTSKSHLTEWLVLYIGVVWFIYLVLFGQYKMFTSHLSLDPKHNVQLVYKTAYKKFNGNLILTNLVTAQAILESNLMGKKPSDLAYKYNNLFGIKKKGTKGIVILMTTEYIKGKKIEEKGYFGWNYSVQDSVEQIKQLYYNGTKSNPKLYFKVLSAQTIEQAAYEVQHAGFSTSPTYAEELIAIYRQYLQIL